MPLKSGLRMMPLSHLREGLEMQPSIFALIHRVGQLADGLVLDTVDNEITPRQFLVLRALANAKGTLSQTDIVNDIGVDRSTLADVIRRLIKRGYISKQRDQADMRRFAVFITAKGLEILQRHRPAIEKSEAAFLSCLGSDQRHGLLSTLQHLVKSNAANGT